MFLLIVVACLEVAVSAALFRVLFCITIVNIIVLKCEKHRLCHVRHNVRQILEKRKYWSHLLHKKVHTTQENSIRYTTQEGSLSFDQKRLHICFALSNIE